MYIFLFCFVCMCAMHARTYICTHIRTYIRKFVCEMSDVQRVSITSMRYVTHMNESRHTPQLGRAHREHDVTQHPARAAG